MPIYEYRCSACGFEKDALQKMADTPLIDCPQCGKPALVKLVSAAGFHLKGSGWYATDFKESGKAKATDKPKPEAGAATTASGTAPASEPSGAKTAESTATKSATPAAASTPSTPTSGAGG